MVVENKRLIFVKPFSVSDYFMTTPSYIPIDVVNLLPVLDKKLLDLLKSLLPEEWQKQTIARLWTVKDVAAHLLDGNIRILSILRDNYFGEQPEITSNQDLIDFLNRLNADWVKALKRASPQILIFLLEMTGQPFCKYFESLNLNEKSVLTVDWAGETESKNWMEIAREYTEKWLHQQQIRDAVGKPGLMTRELYYPFIDIFMLAL
ncbi:MAG: maleylpyruvate isomerase N-terminal domain-containing protein, partial [Flavisolibacter sp.]